MYKISREFTSLESLRKLMIKYSSTSKLKKPESIKNSKKSLKNKYKNKPNLQVSVANVVMDAFNVNKTDKCKNSKSQEARYSVLERYFPAVYSKYRHWEPTVYGNNYYSTLQKEMGMDFTLVSYNILAQDLLENHSYIYKNHKNDALNWSHRLSKLTDELLLLKPHIICLQEVQHDHLDDIKFNLKELNLKCIYKKKTGIRTDGCAIFYNDSKFVLKDFKSVEFYQPNIEKLDRENVGLIVRLSLKENPEEYIIVATTHLLYNPKRQDVRLAQIQVLLAELDHLSFRGLYKDGIPERFPIILTGDFNLKPCSAPYKLLTRGELEYSNLTRLTLEEPFSEDANLVGKQFLPPHLGITDNCQHIDVVGHSYTKPSRLYSSDNNERSGKISPDLVESCPQLFSSGQLTHSLNLNSAYHHVNKTNEKYASTYQDEWITVDYIFYNKKLGTGTDSNLKLLSRYVLPTVSQCIQMGMIPNNRLGSDHLALAVHFFFKTEKVTS